MRRKNKMTRSKSADAYVSTKDSFGTVQVIFEQMKLCCGASDRARCTQDLSIRGMHTLLNRRAM